MKHFVVYYSDKTEPRGERYKCGPYPADRAKEIAGALEFMDCHNFEFVEEEAA